MRTLVTVVLGLALLWSVAMAVVLALFMLPLVLVAAAAGAVDRQVRMWKCRRALRRLANGMRYDAWRRQLGDGRGTRRWMCK